MAKRCHLGERTEGRERSRVLKWGEIENILKNIVVDFGGKIELSD